MFVVGIDAHTRYVVLVVLNSSGQRVLGPTRVRVSEPARVREVLAPFQPLEAVVETSSTWPWLEDVLQPLGVRFALAHARRLRAIAEANYKRDEIDAELLGRMRLAGLIPAVYATPPTQREWATLIRHRTALVAQRTAPVNRIHAQLHRRGLWLERGRLLTRQGRAWVRHEAGPQLSLEERALVRSYAGLAPRSSQSGGAASGTDRFPPARIGGSAAHSCGRSSRTSRPRPPAHSRNITRCRRRAWAGPSRASPRRGSSRASSMHCCARSVPGLRHRLGESSAQRMPPRRPSSD
ncbi:MAG TPA: transposase [Gemmatimonadaceae bacterium]|nr:transposase [Gemmatimonadaceae bacterium]